MWQMIYVTQVVQLYSLESSQPDPPSTVKPSLQAGRQGTMDIYYSSVVNNTPGKSRDKEIKIHQCMIAWIMIVGVLKNSVYVLMSWNETYQKFQLYFNFCTRLFWTFDHVTCPAYYERLDYNCVIYWPRQFRLYLLMKEQFSANIP